ncbi:MAG: F-type H+-transporting ATPase subunit a [Blastocatellia bacterium]|jgi:F-type H+-transporting ATPase subunit a|nr:F-type H+-transporting ATPase subunit a [Blastocatellia bacterium]
MFLLLSSETAGKAAEHAEQAPIVVRLVNQYFGQAAFDLEMKYTHPFWTKVLGKFGTTPDALFGVYTPENAIPWYTVMFVLACIISLVLIWVCKGQLSEDEPGHGQQTLEVGVLAVRSMLEDIVGPHGLQYFPVVMTFAVLILVSNLMGLFPLFMSPTSATSVTFALGISSFVYYNYIGIKENTQRTSVTHRFLKWIPGARLFKGLLLHLKHFAGPVWWIAPLIFPIEIISNFIRPFSLGIRLFGNLFADEKVMDTIAHLAPPFTYWGVPVLLMPLSLFVALIQTFVFVLLSQLYLSEVSHPPHDSHAAHDEAEDNDVMEFIAPVLT